MEVSEYVPYLLTNGVVFPLDSESAKQGHLVAGAPIVLDKELDLLDTKSIVEAQATSYFSDFAKVGLDPSAVKRRITFDSSTGQVIQDLRLADVLSHE